MKAVRTPEENRRISWFCFFATLAFLGLVLLLGTSLFAGFPPHGGTLVITAWWGVWHIISGLAVSTVFNRYEFRKLLKNA